ncbi:unnamed protein product [Ambrosiozyma monospora]|uniref:Unnamed protein product n=1 Tax=Ambrosiozyma monospora TaxID=43982 RepID=A0ACB5T1F9_AMBMO|nr:unnamed protein product [Ambrosiozyma monospora]
MVSVQSILLALPALAATVAAHYKQVQGHADAEYSVIKGFFKQDDDATNVTTFSHMDNLGLFDNLTWTDIKNQLKEYNDNAPLNTTYKLVYFARHAEGYHNAAETYFGEDLWNCYLTTLYGNGTTEWGPDAYLTEKGIQSAVNNSKLIKSLIADDFPLPKSFYVSPFTRCADTLEITWNDTVLVPGYATPVFKEAAREIIGIDTCDQRRDRAYLEARYGWEFEANFQDDDNLWEADKREDSGRLFWRARQLLDDIFNSDENDNSLCLLVPSFHCSLSKKRV